MGELFLKLFNMSVTASWLVLAVVILRLIFKKMPKSMNILLWGMVALRLVFPFSLESVFSLVPSAQTVPNTIISDPTFSLSSGIKPFDNAVNDVLSDHYFEGVTIPTGTGEFFMKALSIVWLVGLSVLLVYALVSFLKLKGKVSASIKYKDNIYVCDDIHSPFILGLFKPKIYLSSGLTEEEKSFVIEHEKEHLKHLDHLWKPFGFAILSVYWFNPLMWLAYVLLCKDIELACDERVIKKMNKENVANYSQTLLGFSGGRKLVLACPVAFGEVGVKERVKNVLSYKKPTFWIILVAVVVSIVLAVCFLTNPKEKQTPNANFKPEASNGKVFAVTKKPKLYSGYYVKEGAKPDEAVFPTVYINSNDRSGYFSQSPIMSYVLTFDIKEEKGTLVLYLEDKKLDHTLRIESEDVIIFDGERYIRTYLEEEHGLHEFLISSMNGYRGECKTEGHIFLGKKTKKKISDTESLEEFYLILEEATFGFENGSFVEEGGSRMPVVVEAKYNSEKGYSFLNIERPESGSHYVSSIKKMFPIKYHNAVLNESDKNRNETWNQCVAQAEEYLKDIGRKAKVCRFGDIKHVLFTDIGMPVEVSNGLQVEPPYYEYIGSCEIVEDSFRYVCRTTFDKKANTITFTKENYDTKEVVSKKVIDVQTGKTVS